MRRRPGLSGSAPEAAALPVKRRSVLASAVASSPVVLLLSLVITVSASVSSAQVIDVPAFQAGSPTFQANFQEIDIAPRRDGGFTVIWQEWGSPLGPYNRIVTHRFSRSGAELAPPVRVDTSNYGLYPRIVADRDGGFVATWDYSRQNDSRALYARRLDANASGVGGEIRVDNPSTGPMITHSVAYRDAGPVYFWKQNGHFLRTYDRLGNPTSTAIRVSDNSPGFEADVDTLPDGGIVVVWTNRWLPDASRARIYNADLTPRTDEFAVDRFGLVQEVATSDTGEIAMVGMLHMDAATAGESGARAETWLRRYASDGTPIGERQVVRLLPYDVLTQADAAYDSRGNLFVVWREYDFTVKLARPARGRAYRADGTPMGPDFALSDILAHEVETTRLADDCFANGWYRHGRAWANVVCLCGASCGDGNLDESCEACDDGNGIDGDGCDSNCTASVCGNGVRAGDEACDDGNVADGDGCDGNCTATGCGNGVVTAGETCDDGNLANDDGCESSCRPSGCGDGNADDGEQCDDGNGASGDGCDSDCTVSRCGNGIRAGSEACDDGNLESGDGCDANCTASACGNGVAAAGEECDDGNVASGDGCDRGCLAEDCGNGRREDNEQCDNGGAPEDGAEACNGDCTLPSVHDSVVLARDAVEVSIPVGNSPFTVTVPVQVQNADVHPVREVPGHEIRLLASDGDCPEGTVSGQPDFDRGADGAQDTALVSGQNPATALTEITVSRDVFSPFDRRTPQRCTLWLTASEPSGNSQDPTPDNNTLAVALDVTDTIDPQASEADEFYVESMRPISVRIPVGQRTATQQIKPVVRRSKNIPATSADLEVTISASDGDCPPGTVGYVDFDRRTAGNQPRMMLRRGKRAKGTLGLFVDADAFSSPSDEAPRRCTALITATGAGDTDASNNTTRLVIDVVDRNDF